jgi:N-acetylneuraminic acid mutarotase/TolB-like protein
MSAKDIILSLIAVAALISSTAVRSQQPSAQGKELVAVLDLGILGGNEAQGVALSNQLRSELLKTGKVTLVDRTQMEAILKEQALQQTGCTSQECAVQVGQMLGVRKLVTGMLTKIAEDLWQVSVQLLDVESGETLVQETFNHDGDYRTLLLSGMGKAALALVGAPPAPAPAAAQPIAAAAPAPAAAAPPAAPAVQVNDRWTRVKSMSAARTSMSSVVVLDKIFVVGGWGPQRSTRKALEAYDPQRDRWESLDSMSEGRQHLVAEFVNGKLYAIGGWTWDRPPLNVVEEYDPLKDDWNKRSPMPTPRAVMASATVDGKIYVIGGEAKSNKYKDALSTVEVYDPQRDTWTKGAPLNKARRGHAAAVADGRIYVFAGWDVDFVLEVEAFDPATGTWEILGNMPNPTGHATAATVGRDIFVIGGYKAPGTTTPWVRAFNPATRSWRPASDAPVSIADGTAQAVGGKIYLFGGWDPGAKKPMDVALRYD